MLKSKIKQCLKYIYILVRDWATVGVNQPPRRFLLSNQISSFIYNNMARISASQGGWTGAEWAISCALYFKPTSDGYMKKAMYLRELSQTALALDTLSVALERDPSNRALRDMLASTMSDRRLWNEVITLLEDNRDKHEATITGLLLLAKSYLQVERYEDALSCYDTILGDDYTMSSSRRVKYEANYGRGIALKRLAKGLEADEALRNAVEYAVDPIIQRLGVGYLHEAMSNYDDAILEYKEQLKNNPKNAEVLSRLGSVFRDTFRLKDALSYSQKAVELKTEVAEYHYQLGLVYEFAGDAVNAKDSYEKAVNLSSGVVVYGYRLGLALAKLSEFERADKVFEKYGIFSFGEVKDAGRRLPGRKQRYAEYFEAYQIEEETILYESMLGMKFSCNPYALFKRIVGDKNFDKFKHVWVIDRLDKVPADVQAMKNVIIVQRSSDRYMRYLASAKFLINNSTFPSYFVRKQGQKYLNTWHGTPWKTLGADIKGEIFSHANTARNLLQASHILSPNKHTTSVLLNSNDIATTRSAEVAEMGYPRIDSTINPDEATMLRLKSQLGIDGTKKTVLYAPTWRGVMTNKNIDTKKIQHDIKKLQSLDVNVLFRGHHYTEDHLKRVKVVPADIDTNELLSVVDVLVTDYSSVSFDFMSTGKPIVYYLYDLDEYSKARGLYFPPNEMAGVVTTTINEAIQAVREAMQREFIQDDTYISAKERFCPYDDGRVSERVVNWLFYDILSDKYRVDYPDNRPVSLMYAGGFKQNGITTSFLNLLSKIDKDRVAVSTAVRVKDLKLDPERLKKYSEQPSGVARLGIIGGMTRTLLQEAAINFLTTHHEHASDTARLQYEKAFTREFVRCFGHKRYDSVLEYSGYNPYQVSLFAQANARTKVVYTHNDLEAERVAKYANLEDVFRQYPYYTKIISVSAANRDINRLKIAEKYSVKRRLFDYCDNIQDSSRVLRMAKDEPSKKIMKLLDADKSCSFINLARLSPEKDHSKLIKAFRKVVDYSERAQLYICGDGPLRASIDLLIKDMDLSRNVHMLGYQDNPYSIMKRTDCFVLSSNYEGQPVVLYEAMTLGLSVVATDIEANRNVLEGGYGYLADNSADGLAEGMIATINGAVESRVFDVKKHEERSLNRFYETVLGLD